MKPRSIFHCGSLLLTLSVFVLTALAQPNQGRMTTAKVALHLDRKIPQLAFAAQEIQRALADHSVNVVARNLEDTAPDQTVIALAAGAQAQATVAQWQVAPLKFNDAQSYAIRVRATGKQRIYVVLGADAVGAMYGGLEIAEAIRTGQFAALKGSDHTPHIAQRGIKFNIPLDLRTPTYNGISDSAQHNIAEMWSMDFWRAFLDDMARHRYNVLSLWSLNPFPSIVKVPEFPHVALEDVWRTRAHFDDYKFNGPGNGAGWWQGHEAWMNLTAGGTMGLVYGAGSLWQWRLHANEPDHADWCTAPNAGWREALDFEGSRYPGIAAKIFDGLPLAGMEPNWTYTYSSRGLAVPGKLFVLYLPEGGGTAILSRDVPRSHRIYDPRTGKVVGDGRLPDQVPAPIDSGASGEPRAIIFTAKAN